MIYPKKYITHVSFLNPTTLKFDRINEVRNCILSNHITTYNK